MCLEGTEEEAQQLAVQEWQRAAANLEQSPEQSTTVSKVFTAYMWPDEYKYSGRILREDLIPIHFPWADPALLAEIMRREVEHLYTVSGENGAWNLLKDIDYSHNVRALGGSTNPESPFRNLVPFASPEEAQEAARKTNVACVDAIRVVLAQGRKSLTRTQASAAALADASLGAALSEIHTEAPRYLDLAGQPQRATADKILSEDALDAQARLKGPDLAKLIGALRRIHERRRAVSEATAEHQDAVQQVRRDQVSSARPAATAVNVTAAAEDLALSLLVETETFPILHRIWEMPDLPSSVIVLPDAEDGEPWLTTVPIAGSRGVGPSRSGAEVVASLTQAIWTTLRGSARANESFTEALADHPDRVWRYPPLIARAMEQLEVRDPSVEFRAAQDRVVDESGMSLLAMLNLANAGLSTAAWLTSAAPPVSLALAVTSAVLGLASTVEDYLKRVEQEAASYSVLDPSKSVGSPPGYLGIVVALAFSLLDIKGVKDAYQTVRLAGQASVAANAVALVVP